MSSRPLLTAVLLLFVLVYASASGLGLHDDGRSLDAPESAWRQRQLDRVRLWETALRDTTDFAALPPSTVSLGPDPIAAAQLPDGKIVGILRGRDQLVVLNQHYQEVQRLSTPPIPKAVAVLNDTTLRVDGAGALEQTAFIYRIRQNGRLEITGRMLSVSDFHLSSPDFGVPAPGPKWFSDTSDPQIAFWSGPEDKPLDRSRGFFGNIDSFVFVSLAGKKPLAINVSDHGVVLPKVIIKEPWLDGFQLKVWGYGGFNQATISMEGDGSVYWVETKPFPPGASHVLTLGEDEYFASNPLLDAWVVQSGDSVQVIPVADDDSRTWESKLGEVLCFTELMAPSNTSEGSRSRFTCETCHFEGGIDGRVHYTGRDNVHSSTKPLFGLFNNKPLFSRALDPDLTRMVHSEFRVAGAGSGVSPWFDLNPAEYPWLEQFLGHGRWVDAVEQRRAMIAFFYDFTHPANPHTGSRTSFSDSEARGASLFRDRCVDCHQSRTVTDDPQTKVPFEEWEANIFGGGTLVWASQEYSKTGIEPYVHPLGTRVPSLRRVYRKRPMFTGGQERTLEGVLRRVSGTGSSFSHNGEAELSDDQVRDLAAFLRLL